MAVEKVGYGSFERGVGRMLDRFPRVRRGLKAVYQRMNYLLHARRGSPPASTHAGARLLTPAAWAGVDEFEGEWFFGYYDKSPWSPDMSRMLFHRPRDGRVEILLVDRAARTTRVIGETTAWNWQQGAMAQWRGGSDGAQVLFNAVEGGTLGCRIANIGGGRVGFIPWPVQTQHPAGRAALSLNYRRLATQRPEYGYAVEAANFSPDAPLDADGLWRVDLERGDGRLIVTLAQLAAHEARADMPGAVHKVNHALYSPSGGRFVFMHRWTGAQGRFSRLYAANGDGSALRLLLDERMVSHYHWRDDERIVAWARTERDGDRYYELNVVNGTAEVIGRGELDTLGDGHPSYSPDRRWIVTDSYPDRARRRHLILWDVQHARRMEVADLFAPWAFDGPERCDLHPRWSPDGRWISVDSAHERRRRSYLVDIADLVGGATA